MILSFKYKYCHSKTLPYCRAHQFSATEFKNHRTVGVGRELENIRSNPSAKASFLEQVAYVGTQMVLEYLQRR